MGVNQRKRNPRRSGRSRLTRDPDLLGELSAQSSHERPSQGPALRTAAVLAVGGTIHFVAPGFFDRIIPQLLPGKARTYTRASGATALCIAAALVMPRTRRLGGTLAAVYFVAVVPAKVQLVLNWWRADRSTVLIKVAAVVQLPWQIPLISEAVKARRDAPRTPTHPGHRRPQAINADAAPVPQ